MGRNFIVWLKVLVSAKCRLIQVHVYLGKYLLQYSALFNCLTFRSKILCAIGEFGQNLGHINGRKGCFYPHSALLHFPVKSPHFWSQPRFFPQSCLSQPSGQWSVQAALRRKCSHKCFFRGQYNNAKCVLTLQELFR